MRKYLLSAIVLLAGLLPAGAAWAHAHLVSAVPAVGATVEATDTMRLTFSEGIEIKFSKVEVTTADGKDAGTGTVASDPADKKIIVVKLPGALAPGGYTVHWHVVSVDTHRTEGTFTFTVK
jgi:methionine-rich copper-binding protein CopC